VGRVGDQVTDAGRPGLEAAATWGLETFPARIVRSNMSSGLRLAGRVRQAAELIAPVTVREELTHENAAVHEERACLDMLRGRCAEALARLEAVGELPVAVLSNRIEAAEKAAGILLWCGRPHEALDRLLSVTQDAVATPASAELGADLALAARAAVDVADASRASSDARQALHERLAGLLARCLADPFAHSGCFIARPAQGEAWAAELARLIGRPSLDRWATTARHWDRLGRPHDAAYSRWRGAEVALSSGRRTLAERLLRRAAHDAREHVPLSAAIAATVAHGTSRG
jgi:hypothetical protein